MDNFKKATVKDYTAWDLNCRSICPLDKSFNKLEKRIKRKARRSLKQKKKKGLDKIQQIRYNVSTVKEGRLTK